MRTEKDPRKEKNIWWPLAIIVAALLAVIAAMGAPRANAVRALDLSNDGAEVVPALRNKQGELLLFNFRAVEAGMLYRSSGFARNRKVVEKSETKMRPAAFADEQLFNWLRKRNIRTVVDMEEADYFYGEEGYFEWWNKRGNYKIKVIHLPVAKARAYDSSFAGSVRAAVKFLKIMKKHQPSEGAVLVHDDAGKDRAGVAVAAYELWRNSSKTDRETLWRQVRRRYLASDAIIRRDKEVGARAGGEQSCGSGDNSRGFVCGSNLDKVRSDLELIAQL